MPKNKCTKMRLVEKENHMSLRNTMFQYQDMMRKSNEMPGNKFRRMIRLLRNNENWMHKKIYTKDV